MFDAYVHNTEQIEKLSFFPSRQMPEDQYVDFLHVNTQQIHKLCRENIRILSEEILPALEKIEQQPPDKIPEFVSFAQSLLSYNQSFDREINYRTHLALLRYARKLGDIDLLIQQLYYSGVGYYYYMRDRKSSVIEGQFTIYSENEYFREGAEWFSRWREITRPETMDFIIRCYSNRAADFNVSQDLTLALKHSDMLTQIIESISDPELQQRFPTLPWERYLLILHQNRTTGLGFVREGAEDRKIIERIVESSEYVYHVQQQSGEVNPRWIYTLYTSYYHRGDITIDQLLERFWGLYNRRSISDYSDDGIWENLILPAIILEYYSLAAGRAEPEAAQSLLERRREAEPRLVESLLEYIREFSGAGYEPALIRSICDVLISLSSLDNVTFKDLAIRIVMQRHGPTYIHSQMVAQIAAAFAMALVQRQPERFAGLLGTHDVNEILSRKEEIHRIVCNAGLFHDMGKLMCLETVTVYNRRLFDTEFDIIRNHPLGGYQMLLGDSSTEMYAQSALMHHRFYDGSKGYPELPENFVRNPDLDVLTDLITVADSMDAATDYIGRSYSDGISFEKLVEEYRAGYDTRYAGYVVDLLDDPVLIGQLREILVTGRIGLYIECYQRFQQELKAQ